MGHPGEPAVRVVRIRHCIRNTDAGQRDHRGDGFAFRGRELTFRRRTQDESNLAMIRGSEVESEVGKGTTFRVTLPLAGPAKDASDRMERLAAKEAT